MKKINLLLLLLATISFSCSKDIELQEELTFEVQSESRDRGYVCQNIVNKKYMDNNNVIWSFNSDGNVYRFQNGVTLYSGSYVQLGCNLRLTEDVTNTVEVLSMSYVDDYTITIDNFSNINDYTIDATPELTVATVGDSRFICCGAGDFRNVMSNYGNFTFVGSLTDANGLNHDAIGGDTTQDVINRLNNIPQADVYIVQLGTNDPSSIMEQSKNNMITIIREFLGRNSIVLFAKQVERNDHNLEFPFTNKHYELDSYVINYLDSPNEPNFNYVDLRSYLLNSNGSWNNSLYFDHVHPNEQGASIMAYVFANELNNL